MTREEIEGVKKIWNVPFIGFFSYGEFGKSLSANNEMMAEGKRGKCELHNNTCCVVVLKEKEQE